jgi:hypothetical protein
LPDPLHAKGSPFTGITVKKTRYFHGVAKRAGLMREQETGILPADLWQCIMAAKPAPAKNILGKVST